jgi:heme-degrading monooxygenase HmoA
MFARIVAMEAEPGRIDEGIAVINEKVLPTMKGIDGFTAANFMADRATGKLVGITFWESQQAMEASADVLNPVRTAVADAMGGRITSVETFELVAQSW